MAYNPFRNLGLKAVAVGIATLLWVAVGAEKIVERSLRAPLEFQNLPDALEIVGEAPSTIDVRVRGTSTSLGRLTPGDLKAVLDVATARPGRNQFHLSPENVSAPFGVEVSHAGPATVPLVFERQLSREVLVKPEVEGAPAPGFEVRSITVQPDRVMVIGPESAVRDLTEVMTDPIALKASAAEVRETVRIGVPNSLARLQSPQTVLVTVDIQPVRSERAISGVPVRMPKLQPGLRAQSSPANVTVTVRGDDGTLKTLGVGSVEATVDLAELGTGRYTLPVRVAPSRLFGVVRVDPPQVHVTIR